MSIFLDSGGVLAGRVRAQGQTVTYEQPHPEIVGDAAGLAGQAVGGNDTLVSTRPVWGLPLGER